MTITDLLIDSFWHNETLGTIQIRSVDAAANQVTYITIENTDHAYDDTRDMITEDFDVVQSQWTISEWDATRIVEGKTNQDLTPTEGV